MKKLVLLSFGAIALYMASCDKKNPIVVPPPPVDTTDTTDTTDPNAVIILSGDITTNMTLSADRKYLLQGFVYVKDGATLTIPAGTIIKGDKASKGTLVITRTGKIDAQGTVDKPIIFTSNQPAGARREADWGGVIILGSAPINPTGGTARIEGGLVPTDASKETEYIWFGGTNAADNSGIIKYVRIEFAGIAYSPDNEINGLTMGGVGSGTTISYVEVYRSGDDAYEWFGGTVNCDHLVAAYTWDDDFDTDNGFSGNVQFGVALRVPTIADQSKSESFESDNDANGSTNAPQTKANFSNMTIVGPMAQLNTAINANYVWAAQIRRNSSISIYNSIIMGYPNGLYIDDTKGTSTSGNLTAGTLQFKNNIIAGCTTPLKASTASFQADLVTYVGANNNQILDSTYKAGLVDPFKYSPAVSASAGRPNFLLSSTSPALGAASFTGLTMFTATTTYVGAFDGSTDWTANWTNWAAENTAY
ncbi:hypothetical protein F0919_06705 [Taibaiella lutea]|uniref:T9SS C-terminal target domain-containing protein n=1 Tax=Taibaiella lutea TaxID=2608001 RepID=A0A5M6CSJ8_9BACT|nr:hypothetical protein [Taibaiella lutea]KAA5537360.1 hypothetical protein F0919_06705 [Taibaiella lutea]